MHKLASLVSYWFQSELSVPFGLIAQKVQTIAEPVSMGSRRIEMCKWPHPVADKDLSRIYKKKSEISKTVFSFMHVFHIVPYRIVDLSFISFSMLFHNSIKYIFSHCIQMKL